MVFAIQFSNGSIDYSSGSTIESTPVSIKANEGDGIVLVPNNNKVITLDTELSLTFYAEFEKEVQSLEQQMTPGGFLVSGFKGNYSGSIFRVVENEIEWALRLNYAENQPIKTSFIDGRIFYMQTNENEFHIGALDLDGN